MRCSVRMGVAAAVLAAFALTGFGCQPPSVLVPIDAIRVPKNFDFSTTQDVTVKVTVVDSEGNALPGAVVTVGSTEVEPVGASMAGNILARGMTGDQGQFEQVLRVPARYDALRVQALILGVANGTDASIENNEVTVSLGPVS